MRPGGHVQDRRFRPTDAVEVLGILGRVVRAQLGVGPITRGANALVLDPRGRLLLVRTRYQRGWGCSGGYLLPGEDPTAGVLRELAEEVGMPQVLDPRFALEMRFRRHLNLVFQLEVDADVAASLRPVSWEIGEVGWFGPHEVPELQSGTRRVLQAGVGLLLADGARWRFAPPR